MRYDNLVPVRFRFLSGSCWAQGDLQYFGSRSVTYSHHLTLIFTIPLIFRPNDHFSSHSAPNYGISVAITHCRKKGK